MKVCFVQDVFDGEVETTAIFVDTIFLEVGDIDKSKGESYCFSEQHNKFDYGWMKSKIFSTEEEYKDLKAHLEIVYEEEIEVVKIQIIFEQPYIIEVKE